jgi:hypothetical protein
MANVTACIKPMVDTSNGVFQGDNPVHFGLPLIIVQIILVIVVTRLLGLLVKPLHEPRVIAEIVVSSYPPPPPPGVRRSCCSNPKKLFTKSHLRATDENPSFA